MLTLWRRPNRRNSQPLPLLKKLFWLYFLLLVFEGALRKWILPHYSAPLLLIRDPVGFWIIWEAYRTRKWPQKWSALIGVLTLATLSLCVVQMIFNTDPWFVEIYGLRSYLLPFPVAFIMGENLDADDFRRFGLCILWLLLPLTGLELAQYLAPPTGWLNAGAYANASQIIYAGGHARASGTFSYDVGPINFNALAGAFILYGFVSEKFAKKWLLWAALFALILSVPLIGARTLVYELGAEVICFAIAASFGISQFTKAIKIVVPILIIGVAISYVPIFRDASSTLSTRFSQASTSEGDTQQVLMARVLDPFVKKLDPSNYSNGWIGVGMGRGAAAIAKLLVGTPEFLTGELEVDRVMNEFGPIFGLAFIVFCTFLAAILLGKALSRARNHEPLPLLLAPAMLACLLIGVLEQPTEQGFMVFTLALSLAATRLTGVAGLPVQVSNVRWQRPLSSPSPRPRRPLSNS